MRQLTSLDAQFLAMETPQTFGHVSGLAVLDPSTAPGGKLDVDDMCRLLNERLHLLPPFRWRLVSVPLDLDNPYWIEDPDFDLDFHVRETAVPPPGGSRQLSELVARICARPLDRAHPLWELYVVHGLEGGRVGLLTKIHHAAVDGVSGAEIMSILFDSSPEGRELAAPRDGRRDRRPRTRWARAARPHLDGPPAAAEGSGDAALDAAAAGLGAARGRDAGRAGRQPDLHAGGAPRPRDARRRRPGADERARAAHALQRPRLAAPPLCLRLAAARPHQVDQVRGGGHGQRHRGCDLRGRLALLAARTRRAARRAAGFDDSGLGTHARADRDIRQPRLDDARPGPDRRARSAAAPRADPRDPAHGQGAPQGAARRPARRRQPVHPARGRGARGKGDVRDPGQPPVLTGAELRDLQRAGPARPAVLRRGAAGGQLPGVGDPPRRRAEHHVPELPRQHRLRDRRRSRPGRGRLVDHHRAGGFAGGARRRRVRRPAACGTATPRARSLRPRARGPMLQRPPSRP